MKERMRKINSQNGSRVQRVKLNNEFHSAVKFSLTKRGNEQLKYESTNICCRLPHQIQREQLI